MHPDGSEGLEGQERLPRQSPNVSRVYRGSSCGDVPHRTYENVMGESWLVHVMFSSAIYCL